MPEPARIEVSVGDTRITIAAPTRRALRSVLDRIELSVGTVTIRFDRDREEPESPIEFDVGASNRS